MVLPHTAMPEIISIAKRVHRSIGEIPFPVPGDQLSITVSIGVACTHRNEEDLGPVLKRADDGLYKAKNNGRNRIEVVE